MHQTPLKPTLSTEEFTQICKDLEHFETPEWAARKILDHEIMTQFVLDPCAGTGVLTLAACDFGYHVYANDIYDFTSKEEGKFELDSVGDFLSWSGNPIDHDFTVFMNPPFSKACEFVEKCFELGARKIVCFQRLAWWESAERKEFWDKLPPNRIYICADRATCWRHDLPKNEKGKRYDPKNGKELSGSPTAHAWFVWEKGNPSGTLIGHIRSK